MPQELTLAALIGVIRQCQGFSKKDRIAPEMRLERDLGITGDDGWDLFEEIERQFEVELFRENCSIREAFSLRPDQTFFHAEEFAPWLSLVRRLFGKPEQALRDISVEELCRAVAELKRMQSHG